MKGWMIAIVILVIFVVMLGNGLQPNISKNNTTPPTTNGQTVEEEIPQLTFSDKDWKVFSTDYNFNLDPRLFELLPQHEEEKLTIQFPPSWNLQSARQLTDEEITQSIYNHSSVTLPFFLEKVDPKATPSTGEIPTENTAWIQFRLGFINKDEDPFSQRIWGIGFIKESVKKGTINGIPSTQAFVTGVKEFPSGTLFDLSKTRKLYATVDFFNFNDKGSSYSAQTISEINQILSSVQIFRPSVTTHIAEAIALLDSKREIQAIKKESVDAGRRPFYTPDGEENGIVTISLRERFPEGDPHTSRIETFLVDVKLGQISISDFSDVLSDGNYKTIAYDEWRKNMKEKKK